MKQKHYELMVHFEQENHVAGDLLTEALVNMGMPLEEITESSMMGQTIIAVYLDDLKTARAMKKQISAMGLKNIKLTINAINREDWQEKWKKDFKPFPITDRLQVVPAWLKQEKLKDKKREAVYIDTSCAFGTGLHATTRFMSQLIERVSGNFDKFLDIGTGTGILSIVARKSGAKEIWAVDISPDAVKVAADNFRINDVMPKKLWVGDFDNDQNKQQFDFVAANLITQDLITLKKKILKRVCEGGFLAVSGISLKHYPLLRQSFRSLPLRCLKICKGEGWIALLFKKI